jgi:hypothetical protein
MVLGDLSLKAVKLPFVKERSPRIKVLSGDTCCQYYQRHTINVRPTSESSNTFPRLRC